MSGEILLRASDARAVGDAVKNAAAQTTDGFESLRGRLGDLADSFRGESALAFDDRYNEWATSARSLIEALDSLGSFLHNAAAAIQDTDSQLANQLR
jgi:WXG100 family type VII secretion target